LSTLLVFEDLGEVDEVLRVVLALLEVFSVGGFAFVEMFFELLGLNQVVLVEGTHSHFFILHSDEELINII
jgi:hypothetical protein